MLQLKQEIRIFRVVLRFIFTGQLLIKGEIDLIRRNGLWIIFGIVNFMRDLFQRGKVLLNRLIYQNVSVCQIEDFLFHAALQQTVGDLKSRVGLSGSGRHDQQNPILPARYGVNCAIDGDTLIIAWRIGVLAAEIGLVPNRFLLWCRTRLLIQASK